MRLKKNTCQGLSLIILAGLLSCFRAECLYAAEWIVRFDNRVWADDVNLNNTQVRWDYAELKNGFNPAHEWYATSEGSLAASTEASKLNDPDDKHSCRFTAPVSQEVEQIGLLPYYPNDAPNYTVSLQRDDGSGCPDNIKLAQGSILGAETASDIWYFVKLDQPVTLVKKSVYHIVIEYQAGNIGPDNYWNANFMRPLVNWTVGNCGGWDDNVDTPDEMIMAMHFNHADMQWHEGNASPIFILVFSDGAYFGQPYKHRYLNFIGNYRARQYFKVSRQDKTVDQIHIPAFIKSTYAEYFPPDDGIHYWIKDEPGNSLRSGVVGANPGQTALTWYSDVFTPLLLEKDKTYMLEIYSNPTNNCLWTIEASDSYPYESEDFAQATWNGQAGYVRRSNNYGASWALLDEARDIPFKLKLLEVYSGVLSSIARDVESLASGGEVWQGIKFKGEVPPGTRVTLYANSSPDRTLWTDWIRVEQQAVAGGSYALPEICQQQYAQWKLVLHTDDPALTPKITEVLFVSGLPTILPAHSGMRVCPNPCRIAEHYPPRIIFSNLPTEATIRIYSVAGDLLHTIEHRASADGGFTKWDVSGLAGGVYIYMLRHAAGQERGKVSIIK